MMKQKHMMKHTGERPFKCDECDYLTSNKHLLRRHNVTVTSGNIPVRNFSVVNVIFVHPGSLLSSYAC